MKNLNELHISTKIKSRRPIESFTILNLVKNSNLKKLSLNQNFLIINLF